MKATDAWKDWLLPMLMADLRADARAEQRVAAAWSDAVSRSEGGKPPLDCLLQVCSGTEDAAFPPDGISAWRPLTSGRFDSHTLAGGHDILQRCTVELLRHISRALLPSSPLYAIEWRTLESNADTTNETAAASGQEVLTWRRLKGVLPVVRPTSSAEAEAPPPPPPPPLTSGPISVSLVPAPAAEEEEVVDPPEIAEYDAALKSPLGMVFYVPAEEEVAT